MSSEKINREVLRCVKLWDKFVFGKSTENAQKRYYDFKGNVVSKEDFLMSTKPYDRNSSIEKDSEDSDSRKPKEKKDTRPEYKVKQRAMKFFDNVTKFYLLVDSTCWTTWHW